MAWPVTRTDSFTPNSAAWNEIVTALSQWGGNVNGGGYTLSNVIVNASSILAGASTNSADMTPGYVRLRGTDDGASWRNQYQFLRSSDGALQHTIASDGSNSNRLMIHAGYGGGAVSEIVVTASVVDFTGDVAIASELAVGTAPSGIQKAAIRQDYAGAAVMLRLINGQGTAAANSVAIAMGRSGTHDMAAIVSGNEVNGSFGNGFLALATRRSDVMTEVVRVKGNGYINHSPPGTYANNAAAISGGLAAGDWYRTSTGQLMVVF